MILIFVLLPLAVFVSLSLLPRGRAAAGGIAAAVVVVAALWLRTGEGEEADYTRILLGMAGIGIAMAAAAQGVRVALPADAPGRLYGGVMAGVAGVALLAGYWAIGGFR